MDSPLFHGTDVGTPVQLDSKRFIVDRVPMTAEPTLRVLHAQTGERGSGTQVTLFRVYVVFVKVCVLRLQRACVEICISDATHIAVHGW